jgi:hypothetical protein
VSVVVDLVTVVVSPQLTLQPADRGIEHGVGVGSVGLGAHAGALATAGDRDSLGRLRLTGVLLVVQLHVIADDVPAEVFEVGQFVGDIRSVMEGHDDIATCHDDVGWDVHHGLPGSVDSPHAFDAALLGRSLAEVVTEVR